MRTFLQRAGRYAPYATYGLTAGAVAGAPGSEYYSPVLDAVGNAFDLPGSSVRDLLVGRNPLDQFASPFSADNRVTGRDVLDHWGVTAPNKETGMAGWLDDPMEGLRDLAGFGVEILTDPLNVVSALKLGKLFRAGKKATTHNAALEALQRNPERQRLGREMVEAYGESGEHTMTLLDAATIAQKKDPNLVYGGVTAKRLEGAVAGIAATSAVADQLMESPLQQPAIPRPRLMQDEANDLFAGRIDQDQYNRLMDESGRAPVPRSEDHLTTLRDRMPPGFSNSPERIAAKGLDDLSPVVGMPVGARLDINEYARNNPVVTLHGKDGLNYARAVQLLPDETGKVSFGLVGGNKTNVKSPLEEYQFSAGPRGPAAVAAGEASKNSWAVVAGRVGALTSPDQVLSEIQAKMRDPQWRQVGYNPERHSYFYLSDDHRSRVVDADEVLQFGDFVLAKNPRTEIMSSQGVRDRLAAAGLNPGESDPRMLYQSPLVRTQWNNVKHVTDELELRAGENPNFQKWDEGNVIRRHPDHYEHGVDSYAPYTVYHSSTNKDSYAPQGLGLPPEVKTHLMDKLSQLFSNDQDQIRYLSEHLQQTPSVAAEATDLSHMSISELRQLREGIENAGSNRFINQGFLPVTTPGPVNKVETAEQLLSALALANPLTYIDAQAPFSEFKTLNPVSREIGSHFGTYSQAASINPNKVPQPFYIRADNVVDIPEDLGSWNAYKIATALRRQNPNIPIPSHQGLELPFSAEETSKLTRQERDYLSAALSQGQSVENLRASIRMMRLLKLNKIDALRYPNEVEGPGYSYVVFDPTNIKSAHNYGSYDRNNPNFYMQSPIESQLPRGATQFTPEGTTLMAFEPDPSTAPHEMAHYMRRRFMPGNPWTRDREEAFAGGFENFAATTSTSSPAMSAAFQYFNQEIPKVYDPQMGYRNLPARGGYDYADLLGVTETTSPLDPKQAPDLITPAGMALVRNLLSRFSQHGGI